MRKNLFLLLLVLLAVLPASSGAQTPAAVPAEAAKLSEGRVVVSHRLIATLRVPFLGVSAEERARRAMLFIDEALGAGGEGKVTVQKEPQANLILVDGRMVLYMAPGDADLLRKETLEVVTQHTVEHLEQVIAETREGRNTTSLVKGAGLAVGATFLFVLLVMGLGRFRKWLLATLLSILGIRTAKLSAGASEILRADRIAAFVRFGTAAAYWLPVLVLANAWVSFVLHRFPYTRPWSEDLNQFLVSVLSGVAGGIFSAVPGLFVAVVIVLLARAAVGMLKPVFTRIESGHLQVGWLEPTAAGTTRRIVTILIWLFAATMAYPYLPGAQTDAFKGMSVLVGLMLSLGASSFVGQAAGGLILTYTRTLRPGEYVRVGEFEGTVIDVGMFNTRIMTGLGEEITLPNTLILGSATKNYSRAVKGPGYIVDTVVTIGYDTPWRQIEAMLVEAARRTPDVLADPAPRVFQTALSDYYPEYRLVCQATASQPRSRAEVLNRLHAHIQDVFNEHGVQIMSPHYVLDPKSEKTVPPDRWYLAPAKKPDEKGA